LSSVLPTPEKAPESFNVLRESLIVGGNQRQQFAPQGGMASSRRQPVVNKMAVAKTLEQADGAKLLEVLGDTGLAQPEDPGKFGDAALPLRAKRDDTQPGRVGQGLQMRDELLCNIIHKYINIYLYLMKNQFTSLSRAVTGNCAMLRAGVQNRPPRNP
jgi:hypothetical protein